MIFNDVSEVVMDKEKENGAEEIVGVNDKNDEGNFEGEGMPNLVNMNLPSVQSRKEVSDE